MTYPAYVIEHGETRMDAEDRVHGPAHAAEPLDAHGRQEAVRLGARLRKLAAGHIYASPARRAEQTGRIAGAISGTSVTLHPELRSLDTGRLAGGQQTEVARRLKPYFDHPERVIPGGESVNAWRERCLGFMRRIAALHAAHGREPPAFVTHSNVVGAAVAASQGKGVDEARRAMAHPPEPATPIPVQLSQAARGRKP